MRIARHTEAAATAGSKGRAAVTFRRAVLVAVASLLAIAAVAIGETELAGAAISSGSQVPGSALPVGTFTAGTPFSSGQTIEVKIPTSTVFPQGQNVVILECAAPGGVLPTQTDQCDANTISASTIFPAADGSIDYAQYPVYALPDALLGEPSTNTPVCNLTNECVLFVGNDFTNITGTPHVFSQGFYVNPTPGDTGASPGDGSAPSTTTVPSASLSTVAASPSTAVADGVDAATVTVTLLGANAQSQAVPIPGATVSLSAGSGHSTITPATSGSNVTSATGVATFTVTDTTAEPETYTATSGGVIVTTTATVTFTAPSVSATASSVAASPTSVPADGTTPSTLTVTVRDTAANPAPVQGQTVTLSQSAGGHSTITTVSGTTNASGVATFTVTDSTGEPVTYTAVAGGVTVGTTAQVTFTSSGPPTVAPAITSAASDTVAVGTAFSYSVTTTGTPTPTVSLDSSSVLPAGVTLTDNGNGTATLAGSSSVAAGDYTFTIDAANGISPDATQPFTLTVTALTVSATTSTVTAAASPVPTGETGGTTVTVKLLTADGTTPVPGKTVSLTPTSGSHAVVSPSSLVTDAGGQATFSVTDDTAETVFFTGVDVTDTLTLTSASVTFQASGPTQVAPAFTSAASDTVPVGTAFSYTVTTTGTPTPAVSVDPGSSLPTGVTLSDNGDGTATLAGASSVAAGVYTFTIDATNGVSPAASQPFTLTVSSSTTSTPPAFSSAASDTVPTGADFSFTVTTTGTPTPAVSLDSGSVLPMGVSLTDNGDGTATLAGTSSVAAGVYTFTIDASNGVSPDASQPFTLTVSSSSSGTEPTWLRQELQSSEQSGDRQGWRRPGQVIAVVAGTAVTDTATLRGENVSSAGGQVTYSVYARSSSSWQWQPAASGGTVTVTDGVVPPSKPVNLDPGIYMWVASYSGDALNGPSMTRHGSAIEFVIPPYRDWR